MTPRFHYVFAALMGGSVELDYAGYEREQIPITAFFWKPRGATFELFREVQFLRCHRAERRRQNATHVVLFDADGLSVLAASLSPPILVQPGVVPCVSGLVLPEDNPNALRVIGRLQAIETAAQAVLGGAQRWRTSSLSV